MLTFDKLPPTPKGTRIDFSQFPYDSFVDLGETCVSQLVSNGIEVEGLGDFELPLERQVPLMPGSLYSELNGRFSLKNEFVSGFKRRAGQIRQEQGVAHV